MVLIPTVLIVSQQRMLLAGSLCFLFLELFKGLQKKIELRLEHNIIGISPIGVLSRRFFQMHLTMHDYLK